MIELKNAGATQLTLKNGEVSDWKVTLNGEELYILPSNFTVQETLLVRRVAEKLILQAYTEGMTEMARLKDIEIKQLLKIGNAQLDALIVNNEELASALERHVINNQHDY